MCRRNSGTVTMPRPQCREIWLVDISEGVLRLTVNFQSKSPAEMSTSLQVVINFPGDIYAGAK
jgi:hypothetical protein